MKKNKILFFLGCFSISFFMVYAVTFRQHAKQEEILNSEAYVIHEEVLTRFELFMSSLISKGIVTSEYFSQGSLHTRNYEQLASSIIQHYDEILGINIVDHLGNIIRVYPYQDNKISLGKRSQNYALMVKSFEKGEEFWISPPFKLFQGPQGFVVYIPIKKDEKLLGWIAPVISNDLFFKKFMTANFLRAYELVIQDKESGLSYFSTGTPNKVKENLKRQSVKIRGRELIFLSWPKRPHSQTYLWTLSLSMAFVVSFLATYLYGLLEHKFHSNMQTDEVEQLLRLSIQDATSGMTLIQNQLGLMKLGAGHISPDRISLHAVYVTNLLEQIKILQRIVTQDESTKLFKLPLLPIVNETLEEMNETVMSKNISIEINQVELDKVLIYAHKALIRNSVFNNLFHHIFFHIGESSTLSIKYEERKFSQHLFIRMIDQNSSSDFKEKLKTDRSLIGVKRVLELHQGKLTLETNSDGVLCFNMVFPKV